MAEYRAFIQETKIEGLQPDTQYFYNVKVKSFDGQEMQSGVATFKTAVRDDQDFMFAAFGDTETRPHINDAVAKRVWGERPNFAIHLGDLTDGGMEDQKWQWNFEYFAGMTQLHSRITSKKTGISLSAFGFIADRRVCDLRRRGIVFDLFLHVCISQAVFRCKIHRTDFFPYLYFVSTNRSADVSAVKN